MAYQKLQVGLGVNVIPSDTINIPNVSGPTQSGSATSTSANNLVDTAATFTNNLVGYIVYNTTDNTVATVTSVTDANTLVLSADIMANAESYTLYADDNAGCVLYVGGAGDLRVLTSSGSDITFTGVLAGSFIPVQVKRVFSTSNTATSILALW
jgi:hypothetical protein|tara:strand:+ start:625 stop:1086 length:462 start_codon:yes stop_codon:yes gene_type:complete